MTATKDIISSDLKGKVREKNEAKLLKFINDSKPNNSASPNGSRKSPASK
jgi:hypothetical protein